MKPLESELKVIAAAEELALALGGDPNHTVAAAAMDTHGRIYRAVNVHHFTGGPCAELVTLGLAATNHAGPLVAIAAAGDRGRGLIPPCGRCRQVLLDQHPDIVVAVPSSNGPTVEAIRDLLPATYHFPDAHARRIVRFNKSFRDDVLSGAKTTTTRWRDPIVIGPALLYFEDDGNPPVEGEVLSIESFSLASLTAEQAGVPADTNMKDYREGIHSVYPAMGPEAGVEVVRFRLAPSTE